MEVDPTTAPEHRESPAGPLLSELDVGALPICGPDNRLHGITTDRDIVVKCLAKGKDPNG